MKQSLYFLLMAAGMIIAAGNSAGAQDKPYTSKITGSWVGGLKVQGITLTLVMNVKTSENDSLIVNFESPDQGAKIIPTSSVRITSDSLIVGIKLVSGLYLGKFNSNYSKLEGRWKQSGLDLPLDLEHKQEAFKRARPQEPLPPFPYLTEDVSIRNEKAGITLAGTLTLPEKGKKFPAVVLITGSGPQNRDEELMGHKPFLLLADYLTRHGIAVLRCDDRGVGKSEGKFSTATSFDFATDAEAALNFLKTRPEADTSKLGLIGHSEGGLIAPVIASRNKDVDFIVLMAGTGVTGEKILITQTMAIQKADSSDEDAKLHAQMINRKIYEIVKKNPDNENAAEAIRKLIQKENKAEVKKGSNDTLSATATEQSIKTVTSPWFRTFLTLDPQEYLRKVHCYVLAINGDLDQQVDSEINLPAIEQALIFGGNSKYTIEEIHGVNHLFQTAKTGSPTEYGTIEETIQPKVLELIASWILQTVK
jgi:pimeloyl-ACP methyl ester carboxylesterase